MIGWVLSGLMCIVLYATMVPNSVFKESSARERRILMIFLGVRGLMPQVVQFIGKRADSFFSGGWDADQYHVKGMKVAADIARTGRSMSHSAVPGTGSVELMVGRLYELFGAPNRMAVMYVATVLATIGTIMFWVATRDLVDFKRENYAVAVLLAPTAVFWSSAIGKEAPILFGLGALTLSLRYLLSGRYLPRAAFYGVTGGLFVAYVRPHVLLAFLGATTFAAVFARSSRNLRARGSRRLILLTLAAVGLSFAVTQSGQLLGVSDDSSLVDAAYERAESTAKGQGRASYSQDPVRNPLQVPGAVVTVVLRPFPWEIRSLMQGLACLESLIVLGLLWWAVRDHFGRVRRFDFNVLTLTAIVYSVILSSAVASYGNFGLLVRQRMQIWPFLIFLAFSPRITNRFVRERVDAPVREVSVH